MTLSIDLLDWLVQQAPVVVVMGAAIFWLARKLDKAETDKDELAKDVIKLTTLWEEKSDRIENQSNKQTEKDEKVRDRILELLLDIKIIVNSMQ